MASLHSAPTSIFARSSLGCINLSFSFGQLEKMEFPGLSQGVIPSVSTIGNIFDQINAFRPCRCVRVGIALKECLLPSFFFVAQEDTRLIHASGD